MSALHGFLGFALRRTLGAVLTLLAISVIVYVVFYAAPGDVAQITCGQRCSPAQVRQVTEQLRLDDPLYVRYLHFLQGLFTGHDYSTGTSVAIDCTGSSSTAVTPREVRCSSTAGCASPAQVPRCSGGTSGWRIVRPRRCAS